MSQLRVARLKAKSASSAGVSGGARERTADGSTASCNLSAVLVFAAPSPPRIAQMGLAEARQRLAAGQVADADIVLDKIDEDLHLLRCRIDRETKTVAVRPSSLRESAN